MTAIFRLVAVVVVALGLLVTGGGVSAADYYAGQTYEKAAEGITNAGNKAVIASVVGDQLATNDCIVTRSVIGPNKDASGRSRGGQILLYLNCNAPLAAPGVPGNSAASTEGKVAQKELQTAEYCAGADQQGNENCATFCETRAMLCQRGEKNVEAADLKTAEYCADPAQAGNSDCATFCSLRPEACAAANRQVAAPAGRLVPGNGPSPEKSATLVHI